MMWDALDAQVRGSALVTRVGGRGMGASATRFVDHCVAASTRVFVTANYPSPRPRSRYSLCSPAGRTAVGSRSADEVSCPACPPGPGCPWPPCPARRATWIITGRLLQHDEHLGF